jgi:hypothetical protein
MPQLLRKNRCRLKIKLTESFYNVILFVNTSKVRKKLNPSMDSIFIKEVLFQAILSELSILKELTFRLAAELTATIQVKLVGLKFTNQRELVMVFFVFTMLLITKFLSL